LNKNNQHDPAALSRLCICAVALLLLWPGIRISQLNFAVLFDANNVKTVSQFVAGFWPPAHSENFLQMLLQATLQTLAIATSGIALALLIAIPASLLASRAVSHSWLRWPIRSVLIVLRSVPEIVWALLFVRMVGLGVTAGVLAIAITYSGMLGKVYAEIFESVDARPAQALRLAGSSRLAAFAYGILPNAAHEILSYTIYRWECAIRASVVLGFVGAGGLGQQIEISLRMFAGDEVASLLLTFLLLVFLADALSRTLRTAIDASSRRQLVCSALVFFAIAAAFIWLDMDWQILGSSQNFHHMAQYLGSYLPPDMAYTHWQAIGRGAVQTLAMSAMGTLIAAMGGLVLALPAAKRSGVLLCAFSRLLLNSLRAVPELVWAALVVLAAGLGSNAGTLALAMHTTGVLGRLFAEALENLPSAPAAALRLGGSGRIAAFCYGSLPQLWPQLLAYTLYRWENNIRMASVMGFVGAGGLGQMLYFHLSLFQEAQAASVIAAMLLLVLGVDILSNAVRQRWI
jgi:phosphonate transport system permease protein